MGTISHINSINSIVPYPHRTTIVSICAGDMATKKGGASFNADPPLGCQGVR